MMKKLLVASTAMMMLLAASSSLAHADTYLCRDHGKSYPVTLDVDSKNGCDGATTNCTITWRGMPYPNVQLGEGCREEYRTSDGIIDLCTATKGVATLTVGKKSFECQYQEPEAPVQIRGDWIAVDADNDVPMKITAHEVWGNLITSVEMILIDATDPLNVVVWQRAH